MISERRRRGERYLAVWLDEEENRDGEEKCQLLGWEGRQAEEREDGIAFSRTDPSTDEVKGRVEGWRDCPSASMQCSIAIAIAM